MPINSVRDNENNRWKGNVKKPQNTKAEKNKGGWGGGETEAMVKKWELIDFVVHLSLVFSN